MDRTAQRCILGLTALTALIAAGPAAPSLRAARWTAPDQLVEVLASEPGECLASPVDQNETQRLALGRAAFRSPLLLGGQAARLGLSCNACHRSGRGNPSFLFPGVSGALGTADVTTSIFSSHRGDGSFNPKPIPDLSGPKAALRIDQNPASRDLPEFIRGLIVEEFDGPEPDPAVLAALSEYVRRLDPVHCGPPVPITLAGDLAQVDASLDAALGEARSGNPATARFLVAAVRMTLGVIDERFAGLRATAGLRNAGTELGAIEQRLRINPPAAVTALQDWRDHSKGWRRALQRAEARSLYNPALIVQLRRE
jgi:hypothetical protein